MCIAIYKPAGIALTADTIRNSFNHNSDGAGFMYAENDRLIVHKGFMTLDSFLNAYNPHKGKEAVLHFRIKTHGKIDEDNTHPFIVTDNLAFVHNGIISKMPYNEKHSDTALFNELILKNLVRVYGKRLVYDKYFQVFLKDYIGNSKLIFMNNKGEHTIINETQGDWVDGCWFSNSSWKPRETYYHPKLQAPNNHTSNGGSNNTTHTKNWRSEKKRRRHLTEHSGTRTLMTSDEIRGVKKQLPAPLYGKDKDILKIGDYIKLTMDQGRIPERSVGQVKGCYTNGDVEVEFSQFREHIRVKAFYVEKLVIFSSNEGYQS